MAVALDGGSVRCRNAALTDGPLRADLRSGTIITFAELDTGAGGLDTDTRHDPDGGDWWIHINALATDGAPQIRYVTTGTNVPGNGPGAPSMGNDNWQPIILETDSNVVFGPCTGVVDRGGITYEAIGVGSREVFRLQEDPGAGVNPVASDYKDGTSSTLGHPNVRSGGDKRQDFVCIRCDDGIFCNGTEACDDAGVCQPGDARRQDLAYCDEPAVQCLECIDAAECDNGTCDLVSIPGCGGSVTPIDANVG
jgi:hypothetical protein